MFARLVNHWVYGGFLAAFVIAALLLALGKDMSPALLMVSLQLPVYMWHQYEEHDRDRFRLFVNARIGGGKEVLTPLAVFVINIVGVWGVDLLSFLMASLVHLGFGLIAIYLTLVNGLAHTVQALIQRCYHPGFGTAVCLFLPVGGLALWKVCEVGVEWDYHLIGIGTALVIHMAIMVYVVRRKQMLVD